MLQHVPGVECPYFVEPKVAGSCMPTRRDLDKWAGLGVRHVVTLAEEWELSAYGGWAGADEYRAELEARGIKWIHWPTPDGRPPRGLAFLGNLIAALAERGVVLVHCVGGVGRTPTAIAAYLIAKGLGVDEALRIVSEAAPVSISEEQYYALLEAEAELRRRGKE